MEVEGIKNPLGANEEFEIFTLIILGLISDTNILLV
jgi:hypothetical protein